MFGDLFFLLKELQDGDDGKMFIATYFVNSLILMCDSHNLV